MNNLNDFYQSFNAFQSFYKTKVFSEFNDFLNILVLGPILFIIFIADLFLLTMTLILPVMQIPLPTFVDRIFLNI